MSNLRVLTDSNFQSEMSAATGPVLVDFHASWCQPCKALAPVIEDLAARYAGRLTVVTVDADANPETAGLCGVRGLPTVAFFADGQRMATRSGSITRGQLESWLNDLL